MPCMPRHEGSMGGLAEGTDAEVAWMAPSMVGQGEVWQGWESMGHLRQA